MIKKAVLPVLLFLFMALSSGAAEFVDGRIRLVLNENSGRFSLYYMADIAGEEYVPFFVDKDPRTSFLAVLIDNRNYRLGDSSSFKISLGGSKTNPSLIFDSPALSVTEEFGFIKTAGSNLSNGVKITITITNKGERQVQAGARFLIDTNLGEGSTHFSTDKRTIRSETVIDAASGDAFWISENGRISLMGSVSGDGITVPDLIHFANWKRLNDTAWKTPFYSGRNFNLLPYSINDSAVCYYYEPAVIDTRKSRAISLVLASRDESGFSGNLSEKPDGISRLVDVSAKTETSTEEDIVILRDLASKLDEYINSNAPVSGEELSAIELAISRLKAKYGL